MKKLIKNVVLLVTIFAIAIVFVGCEMTTGEKNISKKTTKPDFSYTETIKVYMPSEYIDETVLYDFGKEFGIKVELEEFESNEDMYEAISGSSSYDVLVPSDYMMDRLIKEGKVEKLDKSRVPNISNVSAEYLSPSYDPNNDYVVPYMVGTLGVLYNKTKVSDAVRSWSALFDSKYSGKVLMLDSERDTIGITLKMLGYSMNSGEDSELAEVKSKLQGIRSSVSAYSASEEIRDKMVAGEGVLGVVYSGDAKIAIDRNPNLAYAIPNEGANKWVDGFVVLKSSKKSEAAQKFINFMCRPNVAVRNMTSIGYTSPIKGAGAEFGGNKIMFPSAEELERSEAFLYNAQAVQKYSSLWNSVKK